MKALEEYQSALTISKDNPILHFRTANCLALLDRLDESINSYHATLAIVPKNHHARNNLGSIYYRTQKYPEARREWEIALEIKPDFKIARMNLDKLDSMIHQNLVQA